MAKTIKKVSPKKISKTRSEHYDKPLSYNGTFEDMITISTTGAGVKKKIDSNANKSSKNK